MELASMLAGERFSDRPRSVCPVIAAFLRTYNDRVDDELRQDLYGFAAEAVGTRGDRATRRARAKLCLQFESRCDLAAPGGPPRFWWIGTSELAGARAAAAAAGAPQPQGHSMALLLLEAMLRQGPREPNGPAELTRDVDEGSSLRVKR